MRYLVLEINSETDRQEVITVPGKEIRIRRKRLGLTQRALARLINVRPTTLCQYENGTNEMSFAILRDIARVLKCSVIELAYEEFGMSNPSDLNSINNDGNSIHDVCDYNSTNHLDKEIFILLQDLDEVAKRKVIEFMRDQRVITQYFKLTINKD